MPTEVEAVALVSDGPREATDVGAVRLEDHDVLAAAAELHPAVSPGRPGADDHVGTPLGRGRVTGS